MTRRWLGPLFFVIACAFTALILFVISAPSPLYEYRLVTPAEAMQLVNTEGWRVSERIRMTDQAVYVYRRR